MGYGLIYGFLGSWRETGLGIGIESPMVGRPFIEHVLCSWYCPVEAGVTGSILQMGKPRLREVEPITHHAGPSVGSRLWWHLRIVAIGLLLDPEA